MSTWDKLWTREEDALLLDLRELGKTLPEIATAFPGRTFKAVRQRAQRLREGIKPDSGRRPFIAGHTAEIIRLREVEHMIWREIDALMERPEGSCASHYRAVMAGRRLQAPAPPRQRVVAPDLPEPATYTVWFCGDPLPGRSALDQRRGAGEDHTRGSRGMTRDLANILAVFTGSDAAATLALYDELKTRGPEGLVAMELFRIQKASSRAKVYRGGGFRGKAYDKKQWAMDNLCGHLAALGTLRWGWKIDPAQGFHNQVLYVDLPNGQVSFHTSERGAGPDYPDDWDRVRNSSPQRICRYVADVFAKVPA